MDEITYVGKPGNGYTVRTAVSGYKWHHTEDGEGHIASNTFTLKQGDNIRVVYYQKKLVITALPKSKDYDGTPLKSQGLNDCMAASKVGGRGPLSCKFGCLGYGTCVEQCKYGAISVKNGVAVVDEDLCVGCMACAAACPRGLIVPVEPGRNVVIACNSIAKGAVTTRGCTVGCVGCGLCKKICPRDAITITKNLAVIDYSKCDNCGLCATVCAKKLIKDSKVEQLTDPGLVHSRNNPDAEM